MFRTTIRWALLAVICFLPSCRMFALDDWQPINPDELKMTADPAHNARAIILYHEEVADDNTRHKYVYKRLKIFTDKGKDLASVEIPYDASFIGISDIKARSIAPDGTITPFTGKAFNSSLIKGHGLKYQAKTFSIPNVQAGSIIEWKYVEYWEDYVIAPHWTVQENLFQKHAKFTFIPYGKSGHYIVDSRGDIKDRVFYTLVGLPEKTAIKTIANNRMELEMNDIPEFVPESYSPPDEVVRMRVNFYYGTDRMGKPQDFWKDEGKYWSKEVERFIGHSQSVAAAVAQVTSASDKPEDKVHKIYAFIQKMKNLNYDRTEDSFEGMGRDAREKRTIDDVVRNNEGFRDELVRTFVAMVRAAGIPAVVMRVSDRDDNIFQINVPNPGQLTSEIAVVTLDGKDVFLDPGTRFCPFKLLAWQHTSTAGLRQNPGGSGATMADTPVANYKDAISKRVGRLLLAEDGSAHGQVGIAWAGEEALIQRQIAFKTDEEGRKKHLEAEVKRMLPSGATVQFISATGWDTPDVQLSANFKVEVPSFATAAGKRVMVPSNLFEAASVQPFAHGERKHPIYFEYPYYTMDDVQITFPASLKPESIPKTAPVKTTYSIYTVQRNVTGNTIAYTRDFGMAGVAFKAADYPELQNFFAGMLNGDSEQFILTAAK